MSSTEPGSDAPGATPTAPPPAAPPPPQGAPPPPPGYAAPPLGYPAPATGYPAPAPGYPAPATGYGTPPQAKRPAIVLVALLLSWIALVGLILALIARAKVKRGNTLGKGMATAALIISLIFTGGEVAAIAVGVSTTNLHNTAQLATQVQNTLNQHTDQLHGATASSVTCSQNSPGSSNYTCDVTDSQGNHWTATVTVNNNFGGTITGLQEQ
jgi:hypothetical protein